MQTWNSPVCIPGIGYISPVHSNPGIPGEDLDQGLSGSQS